MAECPWLSFRLYRVYEEKSEIQLEPTPSIALRTVSDVIRPLSAMLLMSAAFVLPDDRQAMLKRVRKPTAHSTVPVANLVLILVATLRTRDFDVSEVQSGV